MSTETDNNQDTAPDPFEGFETESSDPADNAEDASTESAKEPVKSESKDAQGADSEEENQDGAAAKEAADDPDEQPTVKKSTFDKRVKDLTFRRREAERETAELRARLADLEAGEKSEKKDLTSENETAKSDSDPEPSAKDFEYGEVDPRYVSALARWEARQENARLSAEAEQKRQSEAETARQSEIQQRSDERYAEAVSKFEDFDEVVNNLADIPSVSPDTRDLLLESDHFAEIMYHLGTNPDEARDIASQSPAKQAAYIGRLEAKLSSSQDAPTEKPKPKAIPPKAAAPVERSRGAGGKFTTPDDTDDFSAFEQKHQTR